MHPWFLYIPVNLTRFFSSNSISSTRLRLTKKQCTVLLSRCKSMRQMMQIHCQIILSDLHQKRDVMDDVLVFAADVDSGDLSYAVKVFESIPDSSVFMYNLIIKAFANRRYWRDVVLMFDRMRECGFSPDNFTYPVVLKALGSLKSLFLGRKVHGFIMKTGFESDPYVRNGLVDMYAEQNFVQISRDLFDEMPKSKRDLIAWNMMIRCYTKCKMYADAISIYLKMEEECVAPDEATFVSTLSACSLSGNLQVGKRIHRYISKKSFFTVTVGNALLDMYVKGGSLDTARKYFDKMPFKNVISWTTMVSGYASSGMLEDARYLFDHSPTKDVILWTAMINGYVQYNKCDEALALFREMQLKRTRPDNFTVVSLLTVCAQLGALEQGRWLHGYVKDHRIKIDSVVGTALIDMYAKCGCIDMSIEVFKNVEEKDTATWTAIICGLAMNGKTSEALALFSEMLKVGARPDDITFVGVLSACSHGGLVDVGRRNFYAMQEVHQIKPKIEHYGCMVDLLGRAGLISEAEELIMSIIGGDYEDSLPLWGALLAACRIHGKVEIGEQIAKRISEQETGNSGIHTLLANIYAAANKWEGVIKVRRKMRDVGVKKSPGCSSIEINGVIQEFLVGDGSNTYASEIYGVCNSMGRVLDLDIQDSMRNIGIEFFV